MKNHGRNVIPRGELIFEVEPRTRGITGKGECRMTLSELLALLTLLVAAAALMVEVAKAGFDIAWKVAHDRSNDDNTTDQTMTTRKASNRLSFLH